ncbi:uncharacterized protein LOC121974689 [Zingiber officinale]|uniref:uncharacterized protein LOC121974689 n=1 Tax=Zingiber officinale TaxID=94328 RepID=UPI001C4C29D8|nr:uncharacterized protein LOC121974689 [Zingiber officinale]
MASRGLTFSIAIAVAVVTVMISMEATAAQRNNNNNGRGRGNGRGKGFLDPASTHYIVLDPRSATGQERFFCLARGRCHYQIIDCPAQCPQRKPRRNRRVKGCFADCSSRCETTCRRRLPNCRGYGSVCYDPRFVGGDGQMFYFHGAKGGNFSLVSDEQFQINAHFIGWRPEGRSRDFTWVQSLAVIFDSHVLVVAAKPVAKWDDRLDALAVLWDGEEVDLPADGDAEWRRALPESNGEEIDEIIEVGQREVVVERTADRNSAKVTVSGLVEMDVKVVPITAEEDRAHNYLLPPGDAFAHLEMQFQFKRLTEKVEGVLGQTYRPGYVSPVKKGVAMPMMGGEDKYQLPSFLSTTCAKCIYRPAAGVVDVAQY